MNKQFVFVKFGRFLPLLLCLLGSLPAKSQDYFQQKVDYTIQVKLDDVNHELSCFQTLVYTNNAPVELKELYIHLWPNAYQDEGTPLANSFYEDGFSTMLKLKKENSGYIDSLDFKVNGETVKWNLLIDSSDICKIKLNQPLASGSSLTLTTPFHVKIPSAKISRLGHLGQAYFITQWYPKPAVYDKNGWNYFSYIDKGEYYGEFGSFDVSITLPENYVLAATGEMQDAEKEIQWLSEKAQLTAGIDTFSNSMAYPKSSGTMKTIRFKQDKIHDFAWFTDKRWNVLKAEVTIPGTNKIVSTWAFFTNAEANYWKSVPEHLHDAIIYFSNWIGPYPYSSVTAVDVTKASGDGMEYPMITAIGSYGDPFELEEAIVHEVAHNWFYGIVGSNERLHPWMDEGLTNFYETRYLFTKHANDSSKQDEEFTKLGKKKIFFGIDKLNHRESQYLSYLMTARKNSDQQPDLSSELFSRENYPKAVYHKMTLSFDYLMTYLGDTLFDACIKNYYEVWKYKHPEPDDMKEAFVKTSGKNLDWFFQDLIFSTKKIDYSVCSIKQVDAGSYELKLKNTKQIAAPISISAMKNGRISKTIWTEGFTGKKTISVAGENCDAFKIDAEERMPELYRDNNTIKTQGILKRKEKLQMLFPATLENPARTQRFFSPIAGWNLYNGAMAGIVLHNVFFPEKKFEYTLAPMYAFKSEDLAGGGDLRYHFYPQQGLFQKITLKAGFSHYAYGTKGSSDLLKPEITLHYSKSDNQIIFQLRNKAPRKQIEQYITLRHVWIEKGLFYFSGTKEYNHFMGQYLRVNNNPLKASRINFQLIGNSEYKKVTIETKHFINYNSTRHGFSVRFYGGYLDRSVTSTIETDYRLRTSGYSGLDDYLFDEVFLGRSESSGILSRQFYTTDAGLKTPTLFYRKADEWMLGLNLSTSLPGKIPFKLYANLSTYNKADQTYPEAKKISFDAGVEIPIIKDIFVIYIPLMWSSDIQYIIDQQKWNHLDLIRWELRLTKLNPLELIRKTTF